MTANQALDWYKWLADNDGRIDVADTHEIGWPTAMKLILSGEVELLYENGPTKMPVYRLAAQHRRV